MRKRRGWCRAGLAAFLMVAGCPAWASEESGWFDSWHLDQDLFAPGNQDRNYTMGLRFNWYGDKAARSPLSTLLLLERIDSALGMEHAPQQTLPAVSFGGSAFTPDELRAREPILDDRPYASLLYSSTSAVVAAEDGQSATGSKLVVGILGLPINDWIQTGIHQANRAITGGQTPYDPKGWHNQISDGGELTAMYQRSWMRRLGRPPDAGKPRTDLAGSCDVSVGYYTGLSCGVVAKWWGRTNEESAFVPFWIMLDEINPQSDAASLLTATGERYATSKRREAFALLPPAVQALPAFEDQWISEWYVVGSLRARIVGYNELMQGGFRDSEHEFNGNDIERVVWEVSVGLNLTLRNRNRVMLTCTERSPEHERAQRRSHRWCGINYYLKPRRQATSRHKR